MTCQYARCDQPATVALRFGDGTYRRPDGRAQTFVCYCDPHAETVRRRFHTCHERPIIGGVIVGRRRVA